MRTDVLISLSNRHVHLSREALDKLFGEDYELTISRMVGAKEYASTDTVTVSGPKGSISRVRVLGPERDYTQVELLRGDSFKLGVTAPLCDSGHIDNAAVLTLTGPKGTYLCTCGIVARRHIHLGEPVAHEYSIKEGDTVSVRITGERGLVFDNVIVRHGRSNACKMHIDTEEGNAAGIGNGTIGEIVAVNTVEEGE
ncbi:MAG TPA: PduL/EutD family phosphate acyltransferase [Terriglobales bacterium]|nr:PduL/EutD family phosphate acyltransferase [Terriglobales bacterium]